MEKNLMDRLDYLEFRQNLLILKQPCHKASIFFDLNIDIYLEIKKLSQEFSERIKNGENLLLVDYEKALIEIWPYIKGYPSAYSIIAKSLLDKETFDKINTLK